MQSETLPAFVRRLAIKEYEIILKLQSFQIIGSYCCSLPLISTF